MKELRKKLFCRQSLYNINNEDPNVTPLVNLKLIGRKIVLPEVERFTFQATGKYLLIQIFHTHFLDIKIYI